jgi:hypothetical protein
MTKQLTIDVPNECERASCHGDPTEPFVVTGTAGRDGVAVYCRRHAITLAADSENHTRIHDSEVDE